MVDVGLAVFTPQSKFVVYWKSKSEEVKTAIYLFFHVSVVVNINIYVRTIMRAQTSQNFGFLQ